VYASEQGDRDLLYSRKEGLDILPKDESSVEESQDTSIFTTGPCGEDLCVGLSWKDWWSLVPTSVGCGVGPGCLYEGRGIMEKGEIEAGEWRRVREGVTGSQPAPPPPLTASNHIATTGLHCPQPHSHHCPYIPDSNPISPKLHPYASVPVT